MAGKRFNLFIIVLQNMKEEEQQQKKIPPPPPPTRQGEPNKTHVKLFNKAQQIFHTAQHMTVPSPPSSSLNIFGPNLSDSSHQLVVSVNPFSAQET